MFVTAIQGGCITSVLKLGSCTVSPPQDVATNINTNNHKASCRLAHRLVSADDSRSVHHSSMEGHLLFLSNKHACLCHCLNFQKPLTVAPSPTGGLSFYSPLFNTEVTAVLLAPSQGSLQLTCTNTQHATLYYRRELASELDSNWCVKRSKK